MEKATNLKKWLSAMLGVIISLLGFSSCDEHADMYGSPYTEFELKGSVTDTDGNPVENASITIKQKYEHGYLAGQYMPVYSWDPTNGDKRKGSFTNVRGEYVLAASPYLDEIRVICTPENTDLAADSTDIQVTYTKKKGKKDDWYEGSYEGVVNFVLKKK